MASSAELAVAKASFSATLFRADPRSCSRDDIDQFFSLLNAAISQCSPSNVQKCKQWTLHNLVTSEGRVAPFGKYLCALAKSFTPDKDADRRKPKPGTGAGLGFKKIGQAQSHEPSARRKRLHILYILNDILYHVKVRDGSDSFADKIDSFLPALVRSAAAFPNCPKHTRKIKDLISIWDEQGYFRSNSVKKLREAVDKALDAEASDDAKATEVDQTVSASKASKEAPFIMPAMHGDPNMPWYDLPAANWLPVLEPNSTRPMKPSMIKPLQLVPGPAEKNLVEAVNKLLVDVEKLYSHQFSHGGDGSYSMSQMGEIVEVDELNGDVVNGETYYGWSRAFCEKMKARRKKARSGGNTNDHDRRSSRSYSRSDSRSRSRTRSSSRPGMKRRRVSDSRTPPRRMRSDARRGGSRSRSRSRSRSYSPRRRSISRTRSRSRSRSRSRDRRRRSRSSSSRYSPPPAQPAPPQQQQQPPPQPQNMAAGNYNNNFNQPPPHQQVNFNIPPPSFPSHMPPMTYGNYQQQPPGPMPPLPPPPPNYSGQWPPPPPQAPPSFFPGMVPPQMPFQGGWGGQASSPPPPMPYQQPQQTWQQQQQGQPWQVPPPPPSQQQQQQNQFSWGRGAVNNNGPGGGTRGGWAGGWS